jgi:hypothetical protein
VARFDQEIDRLFELPLAEFTAARNELARQLKRANQVDTAARVRSLVKPSVPTWTINQLSRREPTAIQALLAAGDALRKAQERLLRKGATADLFRAAAAQEREAIELLTRHAHTLLKDAGRPPTPTMLERIARTLHAAAVDEEAGRLLKAGRLIGELEPPGFQSLSGLELAPERGSPRADDELAERRRRREEQQRRRRSLQQKVRELERAARDAEGEETRAVAAAAEARRLADRARAAADEAARELAELQ